MKDLNENQIRALKLVQLQSLPLEQKIQRTKRLIREFYNKTDGDCYISFSGGKDSTCLLNIAREEIPEIKAVYVDTGLEYPEIRQFVKKYDDVETLRPKKTFREILDKYGYPFPSKEVAQKIHDIKTTKSQKLLNKRLYGDEKGNGKTPKKWLFLKDVPFNVTHQCCHYMKKQPLKKYKNYIIGTTTEESSLRKMTWLKNGCNHYNEKGSKSTPLSFWTEQDILKYLYINKIEIASVYGDIVLEEGRYSTTKLKRTGCVFCMFGVHMEKEGKNRFERLQETHPKLYDYCMKDWDDGGLGMDEILNYLKIRH